jgi:hypothetical protein
MSISRYPYTIACDFVRGYVTELDGSIGMEIPTLSRSEASRVMRAFEAVFGLTHEEMARQIADYSLAKKELKG